MAEERSCNNCGIDLICQECDVDMGYSNWQPIAQEKPMGNKVIFNSEEEFANYWFRCGIGNVGCHEYNVVKRRSIEHGYIRKSAVEEAEEMYQEWLYAIEATRSPINKNNLNVKLYEAIQELKSENVRLSNLIRYSRE